MREKRHEEGVLMTDIERLFLRADFSAETTFKETLRVKLFGQGGRAGAAETGKHHFQERIDDKSLEYVTAARGRIYQGTDQNSGLL